MMGKKMGKKLDMMGKKLDMMGEPLSTNFDMRRKDVSKFKHDVAYLVDRQKTNR